MNLSRFTEVDWGASPPEIRVPRAYNAAADFIDRHIAEGRGERVAFIDDREQVTYGELARRVNRAGNALKALGLQPEDRIMMVMLDTIDFPALFFGAIKAGIVPVPVNTLLTADDYAYMLRDSRARAVFVSDALYPVIESALEDQPFVRDVVVSGEAAGGRPRLADLMARADADLAPAETLADETCFWLYSSGSTGRPKGAVHIHSDMVNTAVLYGQQILGLSQNDTVFSAAKLFFAYGLGNAMTFPLYVGGKAVLMAERPTPESVLKRLNDHNPTVFYAVPTLYAGMLADPALKPAREDADLRLCVSAGEALPRDVGERWRQRFGVDIIDGIGSTEMLHIFLSNRPGEVRYGTTGKPVPGYEAKLTTEDGQAVPQGEIGDLWISGPSSAVAYWNNRARSLETFHGPWTRTGDKYLIDENGCYVYQGRSDDMLKVGGIWVSPFEVESALGEHEAVLEAAVVGRADHDGLVKPEAFVTLAEGRTGDDALAGELQGFVKDRLAKYKYPRWINFVDELPKTATGKTQRFKLRD
ncbi:benzoate-CoA ligase family protein [Minwuia thermotolerans]|uniref:Benzoate-CoA ligase family protein n=1 Tax=Minwuia thermotolerans TaxID=2056226 RepID=A0A2M9FZ51_9PROT|nr:benzoate-CoA ligase family protein [Minwuia thermotolerans]PJK28730.1 benzoate-CoA ligase family protein [Minwuia thermotolerans]